MKKYICIILTLLMLFTFASCGKKNASSDSGKIDIEYYAKLGKIPECSYSLGSSVKKVNDELKAASQSSEETYQVTEGEKSVLIDNGTYLYYYMKGKEDAGISYIVDNDTAFGFKNGTVIIEIKKALSDYKCTEEDINENNVFFLSGVSDGSVLKYTFDKYVVMFVFQDNALCATTIFDSENWNL